MILYYSRTKKTKVFAEALGEFLGKPVYELKSELDNKRRFKFMLNALLMSFEGTGFPVTNMPEGLPDEIYLCGPVWGGQMVGPPRFFLDNADLKGVTVNLLLTASVPVEKYRHKALDYLNRVPCTPGKAYIFATAKAMPDKETIKEQLRELL